ncbi:MAG: carboxypeptidase-like regulatory domain-containing protein [Candidatus Neomarinimicrobiota bacterium]|nr:carboxypeptidase-like regulatory domain-containing protein [Candidatus Neomarinimicrobiota bacterium]
MKNNYYCIILLYISFAYTNNTLSGYLKTEDNTEPLIGANIFIIELETGAASDTDGFFKILDIPEGIYTIKISYISYQTKIIEDYQISKGNNILADIVMSISAVQGQSINVVSEKKMDEADRIMDQKLSNAVLSSVSSAEIRKSGDSNVAEALRRITGVTITSEKNVVVRGLGNRYTETQINGFNLASPEPDKKVVPLNLFPTSLIDKILVYKTYIATLPANFAGGNVSVQTLSYPNKKILSFKLSSSSNSTFDSDLFQLGNYESYNMFGFNNNFNGLKNIVPDNQALDRYAYLQMSQNDWIEIFNESKPSSSTSQANNWNEYLGSRGSAFNKGFIPNSSIKLKPNTKLTFNLGNKYSINDIIEFGVFSSLNLSNNYSFKSIEKSNWSQTDNGFQISANSIQNQSQHIVQSALVLSSGLKYGFQKEFSLDWQTLLTGFLNNSFSKTDGYDSNVDNGGFFFDEDLNEKQITSHRLYSKYTLNDNYNLSFQWNVSNSKLSRPDSKKHYYLRTTVYEDLIDCNNELITINNISYNEGEICEDNVDWMDWMGNSVWDYGENYTDTNEDGVWGILDSLYTPYRYNGINTGIRAFTSGSENVNSLKFDNNINLMLDDNEMTIDLGFAYEGRDRNFIKRDFYVEAMSSSFWEDYASFNPDHVPFGSIFNSGNYFGERNNGLILIENIAGLARNAYRAQNTIYSSYISTKIVFNEITDFILGMRIEQDNLFLEPYNPTNNKIFENNLTKEEIKVDRTELNFIPSINISYGEQNKFRFALSRTKARPQFRELAPFEFQEYYSEEPIVGYPGLKSTDITNFDLRYEKYISASEILSSAVFYKNFNNPIAAAYIPSNDRAYKTYQNALNALSYGLEIEYRKNLRFIPLQIGIASISINGIFTNSELKSDSVAYLFNNSSIKNNASNLERSMQGQSDYVFNALINFKHTSSRIDFSLSYNTFSKRINVIGTGDLVDEYEFPYHLVNFQVKQTFLKKYEFNFKVKNLLNSQKKYGYIEKDTNNIFYTKKYKTGFSISASLKIKF